MSGICSADSEFYVFAMQLFRESGHAIATLPIFFNHSVEQFIYLDTKETIPLTKNQRKSFTDYSNVSKLFTLEQESFEEATADAISFFSVVIDADASLRSQCAFDIHEIFQKADPSNATIILFKHNDKVMLSFRGYGQKGYLSDWFSAEDALLIERMHISNVSLRNPRKYYCDFVFNLARDYYIHPVSKEYAKYYALPDDYFSLASHYDINREYVLEEIRNLLHSDEIEYRDDYVAQDELLTHGDVNFDKEFALIMIEMELESNNEKAAEPVQYEREIMEIDNYEFSNIDPEIFKDPTLMVKWLEKKENQENQQVRL